MGDGLPLICRVNSIYDGDTMIALDPKKSYVVDLDAALPADRFHVTRVPEDLLNDITVLLTKPFQMSGLGRVCGELCTIKSEDEVPS